jgi:hypothetical protein
VLDETLDQQRNIESFMLNRFGYDMENNRHRVDEDESIVLTPLKRLRPWQYPLAIRIAELDPRFRQFDRYRLLYPPILPIVPASSAGRSDEPTDSQQDREYCEHGSKDRRNCWARPHADAEQNYYHATGNELHGRGARDEVTPCVKAQRVGVVIFRYSVLDLHWNSAVHPSLAYGSTDNRLARHRMQMELNLLLTLPLRIERHAAELAWGRATEFFRKHLG